MSSRSKALGRGVVRQRALPLQYEGASKEAIPFENAVDTYSSQLTSIDNMRVDGKFVVNSDVPEGQGSVNSLLAECFEMLYELRVEAEEANGDEEGK